MTEIRGYELVSPGAPLRPTSRPRLDLGVGEVRVRVAGCGLCHTDLGFAYDGVRTRHALPLILGHEIAGIVEQAGPGAEGWVGEAVVVPAVIPCGRCPDCADGYPMICKRQVMPGNDADGGFASHVTVAAHGLCRVPGVHGDPDRPLNAQGLTLRHLAVVADAVSTPWEAVARAGVSPGDLAVVVGLGGVGGYAAQIARMKGATVVGLDVDPGKRETAERLGCTTTLDPRALPARELRAAVSAAAKAAGARLNRWKILECSGRAAGQETAWGLLVHGATLSVVGYTMDTVTVRLSNLMAFDARAIGSWGCPPERYPEIVAAAIEGRIDLLSNTEIRPLSALPETFEAVHHGHAGRRVVLAPEA